MRRTKAALAVVLSAVLFLSLLAPAAAAQEEPTVLVFSKTAGFRHGSIPVGIAAIEELGDANGFAVDATEDATAFTDENLAQYAAVVFLSTTGDVLDADQQAAFERYVQGGGGYAGIHAASDTEYGWEWYGDLVGAYFAGHPHNQDAEIVVADQAHPSTEGLPQVWERFDEWYNFQSNPRGDVHVLATLDESSYDPGGEAMGTDHPTAWCQIYDGGRSWYTGGGHTNESFAEPLFRDHLLGGIQWAAGLVDGDCGGTVWSNYEKVPLDTGTANPMELDVAPDGTVYYIERNGDVRTIDPDTSTTSTIGTLDVYTGQEDGLLGITLDPDFADNGWVYLFYSPAGSEAEQHVSRFTVTDGTLDESSEQVLLEIPTQRQQCCHAGGSMVFGPDGDLYISTGDDTNPFNSDGYAPIDERDGREPWDAQRTSANTNDLRGKILRITPTDDGGYTIPEGNLFAPGTAQTRPEIYAMGLRNPFRIEMDPLTGTVLVADYGPDAGGANPDRGPEGRVTWHAVDEAANFGWPYCHGNAAYHDYDFATGESGALFDCAALENTSPNNTGLVDLPPVTAPEVWYGRSSSGTNTPALGTGGAPMAGPVYRYDPAIDSNRQWPASWDGHALFMEWGQNRLYEFIPDEAWNVEQATRIFPNMSFLRPHDATFGPDGALYLIEWGSGFGGDNADSGIYRIDYIGGDQPPRAQVEAEPTSGSAPLEVTFSSAGSGHPQGLEVTYAWDFGDGTTSAEPNPTHTYTDNGTYTAVLVVTDPEGRTATANVQVIVGNTAPTVDLQVPPDGGFFSFGDQIAYRATVTDPEDGEVACADVELSSLLGHETHAHPIEVVDGCEGLVQTTKDDGHSESEELFWVLEASYTDQGGEGGAAALTGRDLVRLNPKHFQAQHYDETGRTADGQGNEAAGVQVENTSDPQGGAQNIGFISDGDYVAYERVNLTGIDAIRTRISSSTQGGVVEFRQGAPDGPLLGSTTTGNTGGWQSWTDVTAEVTDPGETFDLYVVFRRPAGSTSTTYLVNVNFFDFLGTGVSDNSAPQVTAAAEPTSGTVPLDVAFSAEAVDPDGDDVTLSWDFGDGTTADEANPSHTYTEPGTYTAVVTATDAGGASGTASVTIDVDPVDLPPIACLGERSDEFDGDTLGESWTVVRENPDDLVVSDGALRITMGSGDVYTGSNTAENLVLQPAPDGPWEVTTKITSEPRRQYQQAGLLVYGDDDNLAKAGLLGTGSGSDAAKFEFIYENAGAARNEAADSTGALPADFPSTYYLRLVSDGTNVTAAYSTDGATWTDLGRPAPLATMGDDVQVGMYAFRNNEGAPVIDAAFDYFRVQPDDTATDPGPDDEFDGEVLDGCRWDRIVRPDTSKLALVDGTLQIETAPGDIFGENNNGDLTNFVLQTAPEGDWTIETKFDEDLQSSYQQAGLMVYVDDDNYIKLDVIADQNQSDVNRIELRSEVGGSVQQPQPNISGDDLPDNDGTWWLRLTKEGDSYSGSVSADGHVWIDMSEAVTNSALAEGAAFGVYTLGVNQEADGTPPATVAFDYFHVLDDEPPADTTAPTVTADVVADDDSNAVTLTLSADDGADGSGVAEVHYRMAGATDFSQYTEPVVFTEPGDYTIEYRAADTAGNASEWQSVSFAVAPPEPVDETPPTVTADVEGDGTESVTVILTADDGEDGSGVASVEYRVDGGAWTTYGEPVTFSEPGDYTIEYRATDVAGNVSEVGSVSLSVAEPPPADACPDGASPDETVVFPGRRGDSGVPNYDTGDGCTILDLVDLDASGRAAFLRSVKDVSDQLYTDGMLTRFERADLIRAAAASEVGRPNRGGRGR